MLTPPTPALPSPYALFTTTRGSTTSTLGWLSIFALDKNGYFLNNESLDQAGHPLEVAIRYETPSSGGKANAIDLLTKRKISSSSSSGPTTGQTESNNSAAAADTETNNPDTKPHNHHPHAPQVPPNAQAHLNSGQVRPLIPQLEWQQEDQGVWILLTDDDETSAASSNPRLASGGVKVLEWDGWGSQGVRLIAEWPEPMGDGHGHEELRTEDESDEVKEGEVLPRMMGGSHAIWLV